MTTRHQPLASLTGLKPINGDVAALYGRKSTDQEGVADDQTSVATQLEEGRASGTEQGWFVGAGASYVFEDFGVSGAEFENRPGWSELMALIRSGRARFTILIVRNLSRIGREWVEALMNLKQIDQAGIRVWSYLDREFFDLSNPEKLMMLAFKAFAADSQRTSGRKEVMAAMVRKAGHGHVIGLVPYGYARAAHYEKEKRSHVTRVKVPEEVAIIQRIFAMAVRGDGRRTICLALEAAGLKPRRSTRWHPATINTILRNEIYRGEIVAHRHVYRDKWGQKIKGQKNRTRPKAEWIRRQDESLRIVSDEVWYGVEALRQKNIAAREAKLAAGKRVGGMPLGGAARDRQSPYLLTGFAKCQQCGGPICVIGRMITPTGEYSSAAGATRQSLYACLNYHQLGRKKGCANATTVRVVRLHEAIKEAMLARLEQPGIIEKAVKELVEMRSAKATAARVTQLKTDIAKAERACKRTQHILNTTTKPMQRFIAQMEEQEATLATLQRQLAVTDVKTDPAAVLMKRARTELQAVRNVLRDADVTLTRQFLRRALIGPILLTPAPDTTRTKRNRNALGQRRDTRAYHFEGRLSLRVLFSGTAASLPTSDALVKASVTSWEQVFRGISA